MKLVLLAAGFATRMYPLTRDRAKPLLEVGGRPVLDWILARALAVPEVDEVVVVANDRFARDLALWASAQDVRVPIRVVNDGTTSNETRLGAIGDLALALDDLAPLRDDVLVIAGDNLLDVDLLPLVDRKRRGDAALLFVRRVPEPVPPGRYSEVVLDERGAVTSLREKPADPRSDLSAICCYVFSPSVVEHLRTFRAEAPDLDAPGHFLAWLHPRATMRAVRLPQGAFHDIGDLASLERAREAFVGRSFPPA